MRARCAVYRKVKGLSQTWGSPDVTTLSNPDSNSPALPYYPPSPLTLQQAPYQAIWEDNEITYLSCGQNPIITRLNDNVLSIYDSFISYQYYLLNGAWVPVVTASHSTEDTLYVNHAAIDNTPN